LNGAGIVRVAVAVLQRPDRRVLLAQRLPGTPYPGYWEFPGGKLEAGESVRAALARELDEELGIEIERAAPWLVQRYAYAHAHVELNFFRVFAWRGEPRGRMGQAIAWQAPGAFDVTPLLPANAAILRSLELPPIYGISMAEDLGEEVFLRRARTAIADGLQLIQLREKSWPVERLRRLADRLLPIAQAAGARVLLNGDPALAMRLGCAGVHWTSASLRRATARPEGMLCAASCHDSAELARAAKLGLDFAVLGTVAATPSHPDAEPLGWARVAELLRATPLPVYALGGLSRNDLDTAVAHGAHGIALRRDAWNAGT
jgi:8-oxo-dGTP diphosphatase